MPRAAEFINVPIHEAVYDLHGVIYVDTTSLRHISDELFHNRLLNDVASCSFQRAFFFGEAPMHLARDASLYDCRLSGTLRCTGRRTNDREVRIYLTIVHIPESTSSVASVPSHSACGSTLATAASMTESEYSSALDSDHADDLDDSLRKFYETSTRVTEVLQSVMRRRRAMNQLVRDVTNNPEESCARSQGRSMSQGLSSPKARRQEVLALTDPNDHMERHTWEKKMSKREAEFEEEREKFYRYRDRECSAIEATLQSEKEELEVEWERLAFAAEEQREVEQSQLASIQNAQADLKQLHAKFYPGGISSHGPPTKCVDDRAYPSTSARNPNRRNQRIPSFDRPRIACSGSTHPEDAQGC